MKTLIQQLAEILDVSRIPVGFTEYMGDMTFEQVWNKCNHGGWLMWLASVKGARIEHTTLAGVKCARLAEHLMKDERSVHALDVAERFATIGSASWDEISDAIKGSEQAMADAVKPLRSDSDVTLAVDAETNAHAAAAAHYAISPAAIEAVIYSVVDAYVAGHANTTNAGSGIRDNILKQCAVICREHIPLSALGEL